MWEGQDGLAPSLRLALPRSGAQPRVEAPGPEPHLLHQHLHVVGTAPAVGLHDEAEAQGHRRHVHLGAGGRKKGLSLARQGHTASPSPVRTPRPAGNMGPACKTPLLPLAFQGDAGARGVQVPEVPEEEMANLAVSQGPVQQEFGQLAVEVGFVLEHLHQLQKVLENLIVPVENKGSWDLELCG